MAEFNPLTVSLRGRQMIEANAGTGKTYNIAALYLRLLLETDLDVEQILVLTYTRAATAELRQRIELWLRQALRGLGNTGYSYPSEFALIGDLLGDLTGGPGSRAGSQAGGRAGNHAGNLEQATKAQRKLEHSLHNLDIAAIHTIHGFCSRVLDQHGFASGVQPDFDFIGDESLLIDTLFHQLWRERSAALEPELAVSILADSSFANSTLNLIKLKYQHPGCAVISAAAPESDQLRRSGEALATQSELIANLWMRHRSELAPMLCDASNFRRDRVWGKRGAELVQLLAQFESRLWYQIAQHDDFKQLCSDSVAKASKHTVSHPIFLELDQLHTLMAEHEDLKLAQKQALQLALADELDERLQQWKHEQRQRSYNDLVSDLHQALLDDRGEVLQRALSEQYQAALIDEFQDTDPQQFAILQRLFSTRPRSSGGKHSESAPVLFVGDPKQAMYNFRGADVFAYLRARATVDEVHQLSRNWRSTPALIDSVNSLFGCRQQPFVLPQIDYQPSSSGQTTVASCEGGLNNASLHGWLLPLSEQGGMLSKPQLTDIAVEHTVAEISRLLDGARIGDRCVTTGDIAVLVRKHDQGTAMADGLRQHGFSSVQIGRTRIFRQPEAAELESILRAIAMPGSGGLLRAALLTRLLGWSEAQVAELLHDDVALETQIDSFEGLRTIWRERGLATVVLELLQQFSIPQRLLAGGDGERRLATLFQLLDLLYAQTDLVDDPARLLRWLLAKRGSDEFDEDEMMHLDTDAALIKIVTIHAAKGLEYPIVFCPFLWDKGPERGAKTFHDEAAGGRFTIDIGSDGIDHHQQLRDAESLAEELRINYVALTRAKQRCYFCWGVARNGADAALRYLLHGQGTNSWDDGREAFKSGKGLKQDPGLHGRKLDHAQDMLQQLGIATERLSSELPDIVKQAMAKPGLVALSPPLLPTSAQQITSFSALALHHDYDYDSAMRPAPDVLPSNNIIGLLLHEVLESLDSFQPEAEQLALLLEEKMVKYAVEPRWAEQLTSQLKQCLNTTLDEQSGLSLTKLPPNASLKEMNFDLGLSGQPLDALDQYLLDRDGMRLGVAANYLTGAIDLLVHWRDRYYVVDYKTNYLGDGPTAYDHAGLQRSIADARYDLQYLLYCVALKRHLSLRQPGIDWAKQFGGVFYLYLRGMTVATGSKYGVYFCRPDEQTISDLDAVLGASQ